MKRIVILGLLLAGCMPFENSGDYVLKEDLGGPELDVVNELPELVEPDGVDLEQVEPDGVDLEQVEIDEDIELEEELEELDALEVDEDVECPQGCGLEEQCIGGVCTPCETPHCEGDFLLSGYCDPVSIIDCGLGLCAEGMCLPTISMNTITEEDEGQSVVNLTLHDGQGLDAHTLNWEMVGAWGSDGQPIPPPSFTVGAVFWGDGEPTVTENVLLEVTKPSGFGAALLEARLSKTSPSGDSYTARAHLWISADKVLLSQLVLVDCGEPTPPGMVGSMAEAAMRVNALEEGLSVVLVRKSECIEDLAETIAFEKPVIVLGGYDQDWTRTPPEQRTRVKAQLSFNKLWLMGNLFVHSPGGTALSINDERADQTMPVLIARSRLKSDAGLALDLESGFVLFDSGRESGLNADPDLLTDSGRLARLHADARFFVRFSYLKGNASAEEPLIGLDSANAELELRDSLLEAVDRQALIQANAPKQLSLIRSHLSSTRSQWVSECPTCRLMKVEGANTALGGDACSASTLRIEDSTLDLSSAGLALELVPEGGEQPKLCMERSRLHVDEGGTAISATSQVLVRNSVVRGLMSVSGELAMVNNELLIGQVKLDDSSRHTYYNNIFRGAPPTGYFDIRGSGEYSEFLFLEGNAFEAGGVRPNEDIALLQQPELGVAISFAAGDAGVSKTNMRFLPALCFQDETVVNGITVMDWACPELGWQEDLDLLPIDDLTNRNRDWSINEENPIDIGPLERKWPSGMCRHGADCSEGEETCFDPAFAGSCSCLEGRWTCVCFNDDECGANQACINPRCRCVSPAAGAHWECSESDG